MNRAVEMRAKLDALGLLSGGGDTPFHPPPSPTPDPSEQDPPHCTLAELKERVRQLQPLPGEPVFDLHGGNR